jgi:hypothetical protein
VVIQFTDVDGQILVFRAARGAERHGDHNVTVTSTIGFRSPYWFRSHSTDQLLQSYHSCLSALQGLWQFSVTLYSDIIKQCLIVAHGHVRRIALSDMSAAGLALQG